MYGQRSSNSNSIAGLVTAGKRSRRRLLHVGVGTVFSGAVGTAQDTRSQSRNKQLAWKRAVESKQFQNWLRMETAARLQGYRSLDARVDDMMRDENLKIEYGVV